MTKNLHSSALGLAFILLPATLTAQNFNIDWYKVAGGGGASANGQFALTGTLGQANAGTMSDSNYSLTGGFWGIFAVVNTPGAPRLTLTRTGNELVISWPSPWTGFVLEQTSTLAPTAWSNVTQIPTDNGTTKSVMVIIPAGGNAFFRLMH